jgi:multiple sugar transport system permease protein
MLGQSRGRLRPRGRHLDFGRLVAIGLTLVGLVAVLIPLVYAVLGSLMTPAEYSEIPPHLIPRVLTLENYERVIAAGRLPRALLNTTIVAGLSVGSVLASGSLAGYVFARKTFLGKEKVFLFILMSMMVPASMLLIPLYLRFSSLGLINTYVGLVLPGAISAFAIFFCRVFVQGISRDIFDAATIDGASDFRTYRVIVLPLIQPALAALGVLMLTSSINDLLWPLVIVSKPEMSTLALALLQYSQSGEGSIPFTETLAAGILGSLPLLVGFVILQRQFVRGFATAGFVST